MSVKIKRILMNLTQKQLAKMADTSNVTIVKIEKGNYEDIKFSTLKKIAAALNSSFGELFLSE